MDDYYKDENLVDGSQEEFWSPSRKYKLETSNYRTEEGRGDISLGKVYSSDNELLFEVKRNYSAFPYCFIEGHPNGNDYMVCGEDYQGQTVLELNSGKRVDYLPKGKKEGVGFCWANVIPSQEKDVLAVEGCYWGSPYEQWFVDFSEPMKLPFLVLGAFASIEENSEVKDGWSYLKGVSISYSGYDQEETKTIKWLKPNMFEVAKYWLDQYKSTRPNSPFLPDILIQAELGLKQLTEKEKADLKATLDVTFSLST